MVQILIVEDDPAMLVGLELLLKNSGYEVLTAADGETGLHTALENRPALVVLDVMLPKMNGFDVCRQIRVHKPALPIILLTAKGEEIDKVLGLEIGADDYVVKPFSPRELEARIRALLRRAEQAGPEVEKKIVSLGEVKIDFGKQDAFREGRSLGLTALEFQVLAYLWTHAGEVVSRDELLDKVWGYEAFPTTRTVDTHVLNLRKKIESDPAHPRYLQTAHGKGYTLIRSETNKSD